jgi:hypothetical protein
MKPTESSVADARFKEAIVYARERLEPPVRRESAWPALAAAAFFAVCAMTFAVAAILAQPIQLKIPPATQAPL